MRLFLLHDNGRTTDVPISLDRAGGSYRIYIANAGKPDRVVEIRVAKPEKLKGIRRKTAMIFDDPMDAQ